MIKFKNINEFKLFMKKESARMKISINNTYKTYIARTMLERISKYNNEKFLIKGSSAEAAFVGKLISVLTDIDLAMLNKFEINLINEIIDDTFNDVFVFNYINAIKQRPSGIYKLSLNANFNNFRQPLSIDIQDNYQRLIEPTYQMMPSIFEGDEPFLIYTVSLEEFLAEKLCTVIENSKPNSFNIRIKDFYDIYELYEGKCNYEKLTECFKKMVEFRNLDIEYAFCKILNSDFINKHNDIWNKTKNKMNFMDSEIDLKGAVYYSKAIIGEQLQRCRKK